MPDKNAEMKLEGERRRAFRKGAVGAPPMMAWCSPSWQLAAIFPLRAFQAECGTRPRKASHGSVRKGNGCAGGPSFAGSDPGVCWIRKAARACRFLVVYTKSASFLEVFGVKQLNLE